MKDLRPNLNPMGSADNSHAGRIVGVIRQSGRVCRVLADSQQLVESMRLVAAEN
jgi:hypothetical protein